LGLLRKARTEWIELFETTPFLHGALLPVRGGGSATGRSHHR
jgi:hypothetical protein